MRVIALIGTEWARLRQEIGYWQKRLGLAEKMSFDSNCCGILLALAYPDRIGQGRGRRPFFAAERQRRGVERTATTGVGGVHRGS